MTNPTAPEDRDPVDVHIGAKLRELRKRRKAPQTLLAEAVGVTFQQLHKYETGVNRVSAAMLYRLARRLAVPISVFYEDLPDPALGDPAHPVDQDALRERTASAKSRQA